MATVGSIDVTLRAQTKDFDSGIKKSGKTVQDFSKQTAQHVSAVNNGIIKSGRTVHDFSVHTAEYITEVNNHLIKSGKAVQEFGKETGDQISAVDFSLSGLASSSSSLVASYGTVGRGIVSLGVVYAAATVTVLKFLAAQSEVIETQRLLAASLGTSTHSVQVFESALASSGVGADVANGALATFNGLLSDARLGTETAIARLGKLGVTLEDLKNRPTNQIANRVLKTIAGLQSAEERQAALMSAFGAQGAKLDSALARGPASFVHAMNHALALTKEESDHLAGLGRGISEVTNLLDKAWQKGRVGFSQLVNSTVGLPAHLLFKAAGGKEAPAPPPAIAKEAKKRAESADELLKRQNANLAIDTEILAVNRQITAFRNDYLKIEQSVEQTHKQASKDKKDELQKVKLAQLAQEFTAKIRDAQLEAVSLLDKEVGLRERLEQAMKGYTKEQVEQAIQAERQKTAAAQIAEFRRSTISGADELRQLDIKRLQDSGFATADEISHLQLEAKKARKAGLGASLTPQDELDLRTSRIQSDKGLTEDEKKTAKDNSSRRFRQDQESFLQGLGKISTPMKKFELSLDKIIGAAKNGQITDKKTFDKLVSDNFTQLQGTPKLAQTLKVGTSEAFDRLAMHFTDTDRNDPQKTIAANTKATNGLLKQMPSQIAKAMKESRDKLQ